MGGRLDRPLDHPARGFVGVGADPRGVHARVVHVDGAHRRVAGHPFAVCAHRTVDHVPRVLAAHPDPSAGHFEARRETLEVELEWPREGFVEVGDVEEQIALRRGEQSEVRHVCVAAELDRDAGVRSRREVRCHRQGRAAIEVERRDRHPAISDRHEKLQAGGRLALEQSDRVDAIGIRRPRSEGGRWHLDSGLGPGRGPILSGWQWTRRRRSAHRRAFRAATSPSHVPRLSRAVGNRVVPPRHNSLGAIRRPTDAACVCPGQPQFIGATAETVGTAR